MKHKVIFKLETTDWHTYENELIWCEFENEKWILKNVPFYKYGISYNDEISVILKDEGIYFDKIINKSGHRTYRIIPLKSGNLLQIKDLLKQINELNVTFETTHDYGLIALDVGVSIDINKLLQVLDSGEINSLWSYELSDRGI